MYEEKNARLKPIDKPPKKHELAAFDIEGYGGPDGFELGSILQDSGYYQFTDPVEMLKFMHKRTNAGIRYAAHNLAYDYGILEPWMSKDDEALLINGRPFKVRLTRKGKDSRFLIDSILFAAGVSLAKLGDAIGLPKLPTPPLLLEPHELVPWWHCKEHDKLWCLECYLKRDSEIVYKYMHLFQDTINELGGELQFTLASTAMDLFRRSFLESTYLTPFEVRNDFARNAYYGGRVEPFRTGTWEHVNVYDINSLYPYVMRTYEYPNPNTLIGPTTDVTPSVIFKYEGVSNVTITVPDSYIPLLPFRHESKLYFPNGTFRGTYTHAEIRRAIQLGAKLRMVHESLYSTSTCKPFTNYVDKLYSLRQQLKQANDPREYVVKIMLNSLYGKFGQRRDAGLQEIKPISWWFKRGRKPQVEFRIIGDLVTVIVGKHIPYQPQYINTLWAAYITAYARLELFKYLEQFQDNVLYCDTDSIFIQSTMETSTALGGMKLEAENMTAEIIGPKAYILTSPSGVVKLKCKGVPQDHKLQFLQEGYAAFERPVGLLEAGKLKPKQDGTPFYPSEWKTVVKQAHDQDPKRVILPALSLDPEQHLTLAHSVETLV
jgi:hypothetical protein